MSCAHICVYVQPRAAKTAVAGMHDGRIKIRLAAAPVDGAANAELVLFIAACLGIAKSRVRVIAGTTSRRKTVAVDGCSSEEVEQAVLRAA